MKLSTLIYIKEILEKEIQSRKKVVKNFGELLAESEREYKVDWNTPDDEVNESVKIVRNMYKEQRSILNKAENALHDFLEKDWN